LCVFRLPVLFLSVFSHEGRLRKKKRERIRRRHRGTVGQTDRQEGRGAVWALNNANTNTEGETDKAGQDRYIFSFPYSQAQVKPKGEDQIKKNIKGI
jgi:hypothetical protein